MAAFIPAIDDVRGGTFEIHQILGTEEYHRGLSNFQILVFCFGEPPSWLNISS